MVEVPELLFAIQRGPGPWEIPHGLIKLGSWNTATPGRSETRLICKTFADIKLRSSSASMPSRQRAGFRFAGRVLASPPPNSFAAELRPNMKTSTLKKDQGASQSNARRAGDSVRR